MTEPDQHVAAAARRPARSADRRRATRRRGARSGRRSTPRSCGSSRSTARRSSSSTRAAAPSAWRCASTSSPTPTCPRARRRATSPAPTTARSRARSASSSRRCSRPASCPASSRPRRWSSASTWAPSTSSCRSSRRSPSPAGCSASAAPATTSATLQGPHLPEVPRRPARVRGRLQAHARRRDRADRRAAQRARRARPAHRRRSPRRASDDEPIGRRRPLRARHAHALLRRAVARAAGERARHARRPLPVAGVRRAARAHRLGPRRRHDPRAQGRAPARDHERRHDPRPRPVQRHAARRAPRRRARRGDGLRGARGPDVPARRVDVADRGDRPRPRRSSRPRPGAPGAVPFWKGDGVGRPKELGRAIGAFSRWAVEQDAQTLQDDYDLDAFAARNLLDFLREQQDATRVLPSDRTIVVERFRDEIGDWRLCVLSPYGGRVHAAWGLALSRRIREQYGLESDAIWSDDGIIVHLPDADEPPGAELVMVEPDEVQDAVVAELAASALFGARFRENAGRALLIPRAYPGKRTPLWQQRLKSQSLLEVAKRYPDFPIILETYRECLRDVLDVPGLEELLRGLHSRELSLVEVETPTASPFASSLLFDYVATYMYEGDQPNAERRAAALSLDRDLLRELLGQEELRELIDPGALDMVEADLQHRSDRTRAETRDALADVLRRVGDLTDDEVRDRVLAGIDADAMLEALVAERRAISLRIGGEQRWVAADDAGLYRDALGAVPPGGLPDDVPRRRPRCAAQARRALRPHARPVHDRRAARPLRRRGRSSRARAAGARRRDHPRRAAPGRPSRRAGVVRHRGPAPAAARLARGAAQGDRARRPARAGRIPAVLAGRRPPSRRGRGGRPAARGARRRCRGSRCPRRCGSATCCRAASAPTRRRGWTSSARRARSSGSAPARSGARPAASRCTSATTPRRSASRRCPRAPRRRPRAEHDMVRERLLAVALLLHRPARRRRARARAGAGGAVGSRLGGRGDERRVRAAARAAADARPRPRERRRATRARRFGTRRARLAADGAGPLGADRHDLPPRAGARPAPPHARRAAARALRHRHPRAGARRGHPRRLLDPLRRAVAARDARRLPPRLLRRGARRRAVRAARRGRAAARAEATSRSRRRSCSPRRIPRSPTAPRCRGPGAATTSRRAARGAACAARYVVLAGAEPVLYVEKGGRGIVTLADAGDPRLSPSFEALAQFITGGRGRKLSLERIDGEPVVGSPLEPMLDRARVPRRARASSRSAPETTNRTRQGEIR